MMQEPTIVVPAPTRTQTIRRAQSSPDAPPNRARRELDALEAQRAELKSQLQSVTERRMLLSMQMQGTEGQSRLELQNRIKALDERTGRIDTELNRVDDAISAALESGATRAPSGFDRLIGSISTTVPPPPPPPGLFGGRDTGDLLAPILAGQVVGFVLLGVVLWTALRRRVSGAMRLGAEDVNRLDQLQRSVDVMAVEIERVSEAQRYVSKILHDKAIGAGAAEEISVRRPDAERVPEGRAVK
jgi:hypothetical protein